MQGCSYDPQDPSMQQYAIRGYRADSLKYFTDNTMCSQAKISKTAKKQLQSCKNYAKSFCDSPTLPRPRIKVDADFGSPLK